jgi:hypothetical protein
MNNKNLINLVKTICLGIVGLIALNMLISLFESEEEIKTEIESEIKTEIIDKSVKDVRDLKLQIKELNLAIIELTVSCKKQRIEHIHYYKNIVESDSTNSKEFVKASKYSYWYVHYKDKGIDGYMLYGIKGGIFNFDKVMKAIRKGGIANQYGGITNYKRITEKEYLSAREDRRKMLD